MNFYLKRKIKGANTTLKYYQNMDVLLNVEVIVVYISNYQKMDICDSKNKFWKASANFNLNIGKIFKKSRK